MNLKNNISFFWYGVKNKQINIYVFIIDFIILVMALFNIREILQADSIIYLMILIFLNIIWQLYSTFSDFVAYFKHINLYESNLPIDYGQIRISEKEKQLGYEKILTANEGAFISKELNEYLQSDSEPGCCNNKDKTRYVQNYIDSNFKTFYWFIKCRLQTSNADRKNFTNQSKLCLSSDLEPDVQVEFNKGCYYNTHVTNKIYFSVINDMDGQRITSPLFRDYQYNIPNISESVMSNEIGISTLGITTDGFIVVLYQSVKANASPWLLVPTGSGSADWSDYNPNGFYKTIIAATNRELFQEVGKPKSFSPHNIAKTKVLGFFRWINSGGKPEFVSLSRLNITLKQIIPSKNEQMPKIKSEYVCNFKGKKIDYDTLSRFLHEISSDNMCSFPLYMNSLVLKEYYTQCRSDFELFMFQ